MLFSASHSTYYYYFTLILFSLDPETSQVDAIKCFVCDNSNGHPSDPLYAKYTYNMNQASCHQFADTKELASLVVDCPPEYNACQGTVGYTYTPDSGHTYRSCYKIRPTGDFKGDMTTSCRTNTYVDGLYSCPCFYDNCNFYSQIIKDANGKDMGTLSAGIKDSANYSANDPSKTTTPDPNANLNTAGSDTTTLDPSATAKLDVGGVTESGVSSGLSLQPSKLYYSTFLSVFLIVCRLSFDHMTCDDLRRL